MSEELSSIKIARANKYEPQTSPIVPKSTFVPIKEKIKSIEKENDNKVNDANLILNETTKEAKLLKELIVDDSASEPEKMVDEDNSREKLSFENEEKTDEPKKNGSENNNHVSNGVCNTPPKPKPRTSRTGSICEPVEETSAQKPVARTRTNSYASVLPNVNVITPVNPNVPIAGGYKVPIQF